VTSLAELTAEYLEVCRDDGLSPHTIDSYRITLMHAERFFGSDADPDDLTARDIRRFLGDRRRKGDAPATLANRHGNLKAFWSWLVREGEAGSHVLKEIPRPTVKPAPVPLVADDAFAAMMRVELRSKFPTVRNRAMLMVLYDCGVRVGELIGIDTDDIDWTHAMLRVTGKTGTRDVPFGASTAAHLRRYLRYRTRHHLKDTPPLFLGRNGRLDRDTVRKAVRLIADKAGVGRVWPHQLRHTFADGLLSDGADVRAVMYLGGWSSPEQVVKRYGIAGTRNRALKAHREHSPGDRVSRARRK